MFQLVAPSQNTGVLIPVLVLALLIMGGSVAFLVFWSLYVFEPLSIVSCLDQWPWYVMVQNDEIAASEH